MAIIELTAAAATHLNYADLGLDPVAVSIFGFPIRWYSLAYLAGIFLAYWYILKLIARPGAPIARRHADDMIFFGMLGIIIGGRLGYVVFYKLDYFLANPAEILRVWDGGMAFHGGLIGVLLAIAWVSWREKLSFLRFADYIACCVPFGLFLGRLANFVNGELWGRTTDVAWGIIFPAAGPEPRHPSQLYEAGLEGILLFAVLAWFFWRTDARYKPGLLTGIGALVYGLSRFALEFVREPDAHLGTLQWGLTMGQTLTVPMVVLGVYLIVTAAGRRRRVEPIAGTNSIA